MSIRLSKPWIDLTDLDAELLPAQLGVFQLADDAMDVIFIGYGGGMARFGLRTAIEAARAENPEARFVRYELTHGYLSRWEELMMVHHHDHGQMPNCDRSASVPRGRLSPAAGAEHGMGDVAQWT